jgi:methionyl-tRNA formyltransferase
MVVITGNELRHERFALRLRERFGPLVLGWYRVDRPASATRPPERVARARRAASLVRHPDRLVRRLRSGSPTQPLSQRETEEAMFGDEVRRLRDAAPPSPRIVADPNAPDVVAEIDALAPCLLVTLGGAIYGDALLASARGLALNLHSGWCPTYRGTNTVEWTLYRRDLARLGSTVHVLTSGLDAGPILRRSTACVIPGDTVATCFARVVALGTDLMCEVVDEIIRSDEVVVYDQPEAAGRSYLGKELSRDARRLIDADLRSGMIRVELARSREF